jgi:hypothetical protein
VEIETVPPSDHEAAVRVGRHRRRHTIAACRLVNAELGAGGGAVRREALGEGVVAVVLAFPERTAQRLGIAPGDYETAIREDRDVLRNERAVQCAGVDAKLRSSRHRRGIDRQGAGSF